jgi:acetyltransferase
VLLRFSALIEDFPEISAVEINPLMVFDHGNGTVAVDARILFKAGKATGQPIARQKDNVE